MHRVPTLTIFALFTACMPAIAQPYPAVSDEAWEALFDRTSGWTGADGIFSIPLNGVELGGWPEPQGLTGRSATLFLFSDTFIGKVNDADVRAPGSTIVNNTLATISGLLPDASKLQFYWVAPPPPASPEAVFKPSTPNSEPDNWLWLMDGVVLGSKLHIFALRMEPAGGAFPFAVAGVVMITADLNVTGADMELIGSTATQVDAPLFVPAQGNIGDIIYGSAIMLNTAQAGSPVSDGFVYVYGTRNDAFDKKLLAARVRPAQFADFSAWRFWNGNSWVTALDQSAPISGVSRISSEHSVSFLPDGSFVSVSQQDGLGDGTQLNFAMSPVGPFEPPVIVWECPEADEDSDIFCYNAKAHPHLSPPGELLISYNVNTFDFADLFSNADIYRPRFIRVTLSGAAGSQTVKAKRPQDAGQHSAHVCGSIPPRQND